MSSVSIPYLSEDSPPPTVSVQGCGVLPVCHFDLDGTDCREGGGDLTPPSSCDLRVVTIDAVGVNRKVTRSVGAGEGGGRKCYITEKVFKILIKASGF